MGKYSLSTTLPAELRDMQQKIEGIAEAQGLDFFPVLFEVIDYDQMNEIAAFGGFPTRYPHWRFGMEFERLSKSYEYGLSKIYEMVINNNPAVAYLLEGNMMVDQKLVMAHVYGHVDFFKNNFAFRATDQGTGFEDGQVIRKWVDTMANHGTLVRKWIGRVGIDQVEAFIDTCLSLENLIDPQMPFAPASKPQEENTEESMPPPEKPARLHVERDYMENFINPEEFLEDQRMRLKARDAAAKVRFPRERTRDVMGFLVEHAPLERWQRDILRIIRRESYYFLPQMQTKIMNEGWATYWHSKLMTEHLCDDADVVDYADRCAGVLATSQGQLNPYKLGVELYRHIAMRWDRGQFGNAWHECDDPEARRHWDRRTGLGREKIFQVRALYNDLTFIDEFLTPEFVLEQKMYAFGYNERNGRFEIETRAYEKVKGQLLTALTNGGNPYIFVEDANHGNRGELLLVHEHHGVDLKMDWVEHVLEAVHRVWSRPVELLTQVDEKGVILRFDGLEHAKQPTEAKPG